MPVPREMLHVIARRIADGVVVDPTASPRWNDLSDQQKEETLVIAAYMIEWDRERRRVRSAAHRKAARLLRSYLTPAQRDSLRRSGYFFVVGSAGGMYRLHVHGLTERVERHGQYYYARASYCLHDEGRELPYPDVALPHLLLIVTDESDFLARANATPRGTMLWNGEWRRRLRAARRARVVAVAA